MAGLTEQERNVFELISMGFEPRKIADKLGIRVSTVGTHRRNILSKAGADNNAELVRLAVGAGVVEPLYWEQ